jgi:hypothetical protein
MGLLGRIMRQRRTVAAALDYIRALCNAGLPHGPGPVERGWWGPLGFAAGRRAHVLSWGHICHLDELLQFVGAQPAGEFLVEVRQPAPASDHTALALAA